MSGFLVRVDEPAVCAAVGLIKGDVGLHAGVVFRSSDGQGAVVHLAWHCKLECEPLSGWAHVVPDIDPVDLVVIAAHCVTLRRARPNIPYGLAFETSTFDDDGKFVPGPGESGLTCATFVLAIFEWARVPLLERATWEPRSDDVAIQQTLVGYLKKTATARPEHIAAVEAEVGCVRFRSEEAAAASAMTGRPVAFERAAPSGVVVISAFERTGVRTS
jgi:hypothetical protein